MCFIPRDFGVEKQEELDLLVSTANALAILRTSDSAILHLAVREAQHSPLWIHRSSARAKIEKPNNQEMYEYVYGELTGIEAKYSPRSVAFF